VFEWETEIPTAGLDVVEISDAKTGARTRDQMFDPRSDEIK